LEPSQPKDYLGLHLRDLPYFRALLRAVEARFYQDLELPAPTLDLGCGDGHFASIAFQRQLEVGLDPWAGPIREAARRGAYRSLVRADGSRIPFPSATFASAVSNSVLEHIPRIEAVLEETARVLQPGAPLAMCLPNHNFNPSLSLTRFFKGIGWARTGRAYSRFFARISRHVHLDAPEVWLTRLDQAGFVVERWWNYFSPEALGVLEWGHYFGLPSLVSRRLTGRWVIAPTRWNLWLTRRLVQPYFDQQPIQEAGVCTFFVARRRPR
jgi:SAM-dependent methyltransferase